MKFSASEFREFLEETLYERQWNKDSNTPRDYSKEYNPPGSKEQEERNKRKRDKRKYDKENGECPSEEELHHVNGIDGDELECEPVSKNRGRKEKSRLKDGEIQIKIIEDELKNIIKEETQMALQEIFGALAGAALKSAASGAASWAGKKAGEAAMDTVFGDDEEEDKDPRGIERKMKNLNIQTYDELDKALDTVFSKATKDKLSGDPKKVISKLKLTPSVISQLGEGI